MKSNQTKEELERDVSLFSQRANRSMMMNDRNKWIKKRDIAIRKLSKLTKKSDDETTTR